VPLVSRVLPSDLCQIHKKGTSFRLDTTLVDFAMNDMKWERGEITFLFDGDAKPPHSLIVMDNKAGVYQRVRYLVRTLIFVYNFIDYEKYYYSKFQRKLNQRLKMKLI